MVGPGRAVGDYGLGSLLQRLAEQKFEFTDFIAAIDRSAEIVALHEQTIVPDGFSNHWKFQDRRRQVRQRGARKICK